MAELFDIERSFDEIRNKSRVSTPNPWLDTKFNRIDPWGKEPGIMVDDIPERLGLIQEGQPLELLGNDFIDLGDTPNNYGKNEQFVKTDGAGNLTFDWPYWVKAGSTIYYKKGNVGVGLSAPLVRFHTFGDNILDGAVTINESGRDKDFRVEGDAELNLLFCDASTDRIAVGLNVPYCRTHIRGVVCADYVGLHLDTILLIENDDNVYIQLQGATNANVGIIFADDNYNPPAGLIRYDFANDQIEFGIATNELVFFKSNHAVFSYGYIHLDSPNTYAVFVADSHNADSYVEYKEDGSTKWTAGFDYTDSFKYQISEGVPGTNVRFEIEPSGLINCYVHTCIRLGLELRFYDNGNYVGFEAPALSGNQIWVLPDADGPANEVLGTDNSGNLIWRTHDELAGFVANEHIDWTNASDNFVTTGTLGCGQLTVTMNSDTIVLTHDGADAYFKTSDGSFIFQTDEGDNTSTYLKIKGKGTGRGLLDIYDQDDAENLRIQCYNEDAHIKIIGTSPGKIRFQNDVVQDTTFYDSITSGNPYVYFYGYKTGVGAKWGRLSVFNDGLFFIDGQEGFKLLVNGSSKVLIGATVFTSFIDMNLQDDKIVQFGDGNDYSMGYYSTDDELQIVDGATLDANVRLKIIADGGIFLPGLKSGANQGAAGSAAGELWIDTGDQTVKVGV